MKCEGVLMNGVPPHSLAIPYHSHSPEVGALRFVLVSDVPSSSVIRQHGSTMFEPNNARVRLDASFLLFVVPIHDKNLLLLADGLASPLGNSITDPRLLR